VIWTAYAMFDAKARASTSLIATSTPDSRTIEHQVNVKYALCNLGHGATSTTDNFQLIRARRTRSHRPASYNTWTSFFAFTGDCLIRCTLLRLQEVKLSQLTGIVLAAQDFLVINFADSSVPDLIVVTFERLFSWQDPTYQSSYLPMTFLIGRSRTSRSYVEDDYHSSTMARQCHQSSAITFLAHDDYIHGKPRDDSGALPIQSKGPIS